MLYSIEHTIVTILMHQDYDLRANTALTGKDSPSRYLLPFSPRRAILGYETRVVSRPRYS